MANRNINWDEFFISIAKLSAGRSKDPNTQVGACIVNQDNRILSIGYNGTPNGFADEDFPWSREGGFTESKYAYVCHAELNAILNYHGSRNDLKGARIYVDLFPCNECAKAIIQSGISEVVYLSDKYKDSDNNFVSRKILTECGVKIRKLDNLPHEKIEISLLPDEPLNIR